MDLLYARGLDDLVLLDRVDEDAVFDALKSRFVTGSNPSMYTLIGGILVAMNPYRLLTTPDGKPLYHESVMDAYRGRVSDARVRWGGAAA